VLFITIFFFYRHLKVNKDEYKMWSKDAEMWPNACGPDTESSSLYMYTYEHSHAQ